MSAVSVQDILAAKREEAVTIAARRPRPRSRAPHDFAAALRIPGLSVIAEIKRSSPSHGEFGVDVDVLLKAYEDAGVDALSILADRHFGMSPDDFVSLAARTDKPILWKDFILTSDQIRYAWECGADAVLLIASFLSERELMELSSHAELLGMDVLIEGHNAADLKKIPRSAKIVGINNRDLSSREYATDTETSARLLTEVDPSALRVAESGYSSPEEVPKGFDAVLIGAGMIRKFLTGEDLRELVRDFHASVSS